MVFSDASNKDDLQLDCRLIDTLRDDFNKNVRAEPRMFGDDHSKSQGSDTTGTQASLFSSVEWVVGSR